MKRCIKGTYVHVDREHAFRYLDEQSYRYNNRADNDKGRFVELIGAVSGKRLTYKKLTGKSDA